MNEKEMGEWMDGNLNTPTIKINKVLGYNSYIRAILYCPDCGERHIDQDEWAKRLHTTHLCAKCGKMFKPFERDSFGVER